MKDAPLVLVTGGSGFVGLHTLVLLLQNGFRVRTTIRSSKSKDTILQTLESHHIAHEGQLSFIETELTQDRNWERAMEGCTYVLSIASPVFFEVPKNEAEAIRPAVEGILRILKFARAADVKRVVMTSNFGAVGFSQTNKNRTTTEADWTDVNLKGLSVYEKSKTLAERAAWDFIAKEGKGLEFATINPVAILGPSLNGHFTGSFHLLQNLLNGSMKAVPEIPLNVVDVRDVAQLHLRAMTAPQAKGQRFIASAHGQISLLQIAQLLKTERPELAAKVTTKKLPYLMLRILSPFVAKAREAVMFMNMGRNLSTAKAQELLGWQPLAPQEALILESVDSLVKYHKIS